MKNTIIELENGFEWVMYDHLEEFIQAGLQMQNGMSYEGFAINYSEKMHLYYLLNKEGKVVLNASFFKEDGKYSIVLAHKNIFPTREYEDMIKALFVYLDKEDSFEEVRFKES